MPFRVPPNVGDLVRQIEAETGPGADPDTRVQKQRMRARLLIAHASHGVPYYAERLRQMQGWIGDWQMWRLWVPVLTRQNVREHAGAIVARRLPADRAKLPVWPTYTSGSTGTPVRVLRCFGAAQYWRAHLVLNHSVHAHDPRRRMAVVRASSAGAFPDGERQDDWGPSIVEALGLAPDECGPCFSLAMTTPIPQQVEWLRRVRPDYLMTTPSLLDEIARHCLASRITDLRFAGILTITERLRDDTRALCLHAFGPDARIADAYSAREVGCIALQCPRPTDPQRPVYHVCETSVLLEVLDNRGELCTRPGKVGRVIVTTLQNYAMPLLRYDLGDYAEVGSPDDCACGRAHACGTGGTPILRRILGREQQLLRYPNGTVRWPALASDDIRELLATIPTLARYQFVQSDYRHLIVRIVLAGIGLAGLSGADAPPRLDDDAQQRLITWVRRKFNWPHVVEVQHCETLERTDGGKFFDFIRIDRS